MRRSAVIAALLVVASVGGAVGVAALDSKTPASAECTGRITSPAQGMTVISVQGARLTGEHRGKRRARLVGVGPRGSIEWVHRLGPKKDIVWSYDIDPLPNGNLFGTATRPKKTVLYELDPRTGEWVWSEVVDYTDTHDADKLGPHLVVIAHMRNYNETTGKNNDRVVIYNRTSDEVVWQWRFRSAYSKSVGGTYVDDWTHVNDVDRIAPGKFLLSPRNLDQVIVVDRKTGKITLKLGSDGNYDVMKKQHNPVYLESEGGKPTILVADSENARIVEYERQGDGSWKRTWELGSPAVFSWPRDADRLPNGNTLIADSANHRVVEVTPEGEVVWEFYAPWLVYEVERVRLGDEAYGHDRPTIADLGKTGTYPLKNGDPRPKSNLTACAAKIRNFENDYPLDGTPKTSDGTPRTDDTTPRTDDTTPRTDDSTPDTDDGTPRTDDTTPNAGTDTTDGTADTTDSPTDDGTDTPGQPGLGIVAGILGLFVLALLFAARRDQH